MQTDPMKWFFIQFYLKTNYEELLGRAMDEDRERASIYFKPKLKAV